MVLTLGGGNGVDEGDLLEALVGQHAHANLPPLVNPLKGCGGHDTIEQDKVGREVLDWELLPVDLQGVLLLPATVHRLGNIVRAHGEQADGVLIQPFRPEPRKVRPADDLGVVASLGLGLKTTLTCILSQKTCWNLSPRTAWKHSTTSTLKI